MIHQLTDRFFSKRSQPWVQDAALSQHGIANLMGRAHRYNSWRYGKRIRAHQQAYDLNAASLLEGCGASKGFKPSNIMKDGWAIDTSGSLPFLDELLAEGAAIIKERGGVKHSDVQQPFLRNLMVNEDLKTYPSILNFVTSHEVLGTVMEYMKTVPVFSKTRPPGARFMESNAHLDPEADGPFRASQFYHLDIHDKPLVYVLVLVSDVTAEGGPWTFLPASVSARAAKALSYQQPGVPYRVSDEAMYEVVDSSEAITFAYPKGTVLFIDSSQCFHYGSRNAFDPRFQLMYAYTSACRGDFSETFMPRFPSPISDSDPDLRKMVLR